MIKEQKKITNICAGYRSKDAGITVISLVITIIVILILAGVSIVALTGDNGILTRATGSKVQNEKAEADDRIKLVISDWKIEKYAGDKTIVQFLEDVKAKGEIDDWTDNEDGTYNIEINGYVATIDDDGDIMEETAKVGPRPQVSDIKVVLASSGSGTGVGAKTQEEGTTLYINFNHSIENGTTTVSPSLPYAVTKNGKVEFTITGTVGTQTYAKKINITVDQFDTTVKIGTYVKYNVTYTDMYTKYEFTENDGWRVLDPGTENEDGTYTGTKIISTGLPANIKRGTVDMESISWAGTSEQITAYANKFYASSSSSNNNMYTAAGLYYNFGKIVFNQGSSPSAETGGYIEINGKTSGSLEETEFLVDGAIEVHNLTLYELNEARNKKTGATTYGLNHADSNSVSAITDTNDAAIGLFKLNGLEGKFNYTAKDTSGYILSSPDKASIKGIIEVYTSGRILINTSSIRYLRPVVELPNNYHLELGSN